MQEEDWKWVESWGQRRKKFDSPKRNVSLLMKCESKCEGGIEDQQATSLCLLNLWVLWDLTRAMAHKGVSHKGDNWLHQGHPSSCGFSPLSLLLMEEMGWISCGVAHRVRSDGWGLCGYQVATDVQWKCVPAGGERQDARKTLMSKAAPVGRRTQFVTGIWGRRGCHWQPWGMQSKPFPSLLDLIL